MNDYSYGSGWGSGAGFSADYGLSPYAPGYSNQGFQAPSFNNSNNGYSSSGTNYSLGTAYGGSSNGFTAPAYGNASNGYMGTPADYGLSPYQPLYSNTGLIPQSSWGKDLSGDVLRYNYGGKDSGGNYIPYPSQYFNPSSTPTAPQVDSYNSQGFNSKGLDIMGRNYNPTSGLNYKTGGFNYDSGLSPFQGSAVTTAATADAGATPTDYSLNSMVKDDLKRRLSREDGGPAPQSSKALEALVGGLNKLFNSKNAGNTVGTLAGLYQGNRANQLNQEQSGNIAQQQALMAQQQQFAQQQAQSLAGMFGQDSSYAQAMRKQLDRKDAASGRRSQYGTREVELQARLADAASRVAPSISGFNQQANTIGNGIITAGQAGMANRQQGLATDGQQLKRVIDLAGTAGAFSGLEGMFSGIGNSRGNNRNAGAGSNFWDSWFKQE